MPKTYYCFRVDNRKDIAIFHVTGVFKDHIETDFIFRTDDYSRIVLNTENETARNPNSFFFSKYVEVATIDDFRMAIKRTFENRF